MEEVDEGGRPLSGLVIDGVLLLREPRGVLASLSEDLMRDMAALLRSLTGVER